MNHVRWTNPWLACPLAAAAGGLGWGIRGQFGHETGAAIAGVLVGFVVVLVFTPWLNALRNAQIVALMAVGISFGGSMTYGQTVGLTHDAELRGNTAALCWGFLGLAIKGGIWIGFAGAFLGMGMSACRYRLREWLALIPLLTVTLLVGMTLVNGPYAPEERLLPTFYFSDHWDWEPDRLDLKPRPERWGGLLLSLGTLFAYVAFVRRDRLTRNLLLWGVVAGGLGFPLGQSVQAYHAWNPQVFQADFWRAIEPAMNWWNLMETVFGATFGAILAFGIWRNRRHLDRGLNQTETRKVGWLPLESMLVLAHCVTLYLWNFRSVSSLDRVADLAIPMALLPAVLILAGRWGPYLVALPVTLMPIAGKTLREMSYRTGDLSVEHGWLLLIALPLAVSTLTAVGFAELDRRRPCGAVFAAVGLLLSVWTYFGLNYVFFRYPWSTEVTSRTSNNWVFFYFALLLTAPAFMILWRRGLSGGTVGERGMPIGDDT